MLDNTEHFVKLPAVSGRVDLLVRRLHRMGEYTIKHSSVGWWVDGCYGYLVAGYYDNKKDAVVNAIFNIKQAKKYGRSPSWMYV